MKNLSFLQGGLAAIALLAAAPATAADTLRVVTTIPDLADLVQEIGGDRVEVKSLAKGTENIHTVPLKPSSLARMNKADVFVQIGLSLEHAYVPGLMETARNKRIQPGSKGFISVSKGWEPIEVPDEISRGIAVDLHPMGNPHINLDPRAGRHMAQRILEGLIGVQPDSKAYFEERHASWIERLEKAEERWAKIGAKLAGHKLVSYHRYYSYFVEHYDLEFVGTIEAKPGVPPSPTDLARIIKTMRAKGAKVIATPKWSNNKNVRSVAGKTDAEVIELPSMVGGSDRAKTWIGLMDMIHEELAKAYGIEVSEGAP